jgi:uncharacterized protein (UPF0335 family)
MRFRCVECDEIFEGNFREHSKTEEHQLNEKVNWVVKTMKGVGIDLDTLTKVLNSRDENSKHGEIIL